MGISALYQHKIQVLTDNVQQLKKSNDKDFVRRMSALNQFPDEEDISIKQKKYVDALINKV